MPDVTPTIHLVHGPDETVNRNWDILDAAVKALGLRTIIPDNVLVQGNLEVAGQTQLDGLLTTSAGATIAGGLLAGTVESQGLLKADGPVSFQPGSIDPAALVPGAAIYLAASGVAQTAQQAVGTTPFQMATLLMDPSEDANRWELVICQATLRFALGGDTGPILTNATLTIRRGGAAGADQQSRIVSQNMTRQTYLDVPITLARVTKPPMLDENRWSLMVSADATVMSVKCVFAQVHCIQFR